MSATAPPARRRVVLVGRANSGKTSLLMHLTGSLQRPVNFPGTSVEAIESNLASHSALRIAERRTLGKDYARTLAHWNTRFQDRWPDVAALGFDETFRRMWEFYLAYCEAGFRVGYLDVFQFALTRP